MTNTPLISIIVPVYNVEKYLPHCMESILKQTYTNLEIILVDDGSTDNSGNLCEEYARNDNRIKVIHKQNAGISHTRNTGIANSSAELITFIDSDDYVTNNYVEYLYSLIEKSNCKLAIGAHTIYYTSGKTNYKGIGENKEEIYDSKQALEQILLDEKLDISVWAKLFYKELFDGIEFPNGKKFEEPATMYKVIDKAGTVICGGNSNYFYQIRPQSITTAGTFLGKLDLIVHTKTMCSDIVAKYPELSTVADRRLVWAYFSTLNQLLKCPDRNAYKNEEKEIVSFLKSKRSKIKSQTVYSKRDKLASFALSFGVIFYNFIWKIYAKVSKS